MNRFPYITDYVNELFATEKERWDYIFLRPLIVVSYFIRCIAFPIKFVVHRVPYGFEGYVIDWVLSFGMKYLARREAIELMIRHVQIEPLLYRHLLTRHPSHPKYTANRKFNGIAGDYGVERIKDVYWNNLTIGHDQLSYEIVDRFDKNLFLENLDYTRTCKPDDHNAFSKQALEENKRHSLQLLGATNVVLLIVVTITIFADLKTAVNALNSFGSDSIVLWCLKKIYVDDPAVQIDLDFFMLLPAIAGTTTAARSSRIPASICTITLSSTKSCMICCAPTRRSRSRHRVWHTFHEMLYHTHGIVPAGSRDR